MPDVPLSVEVNVPNEPKSRPVVVEEEGCSAAVEIPVVVVLGTWGFGGEGFVPNSPPAPPGLEENEKFAVPGGDVEEVGFRVSSFEETASVPKEKGPLVNGALELLLLGFPSLNPKEFFADGAIDAVLLEEPNPEAPVILGDKPLDASLFPMLAKILLLELSREMSSLPDMVLEPNRPFSGVAFRMLLKGDAALEPNGWWRGDADVLLSDDPPKVPEMIPSVDEELVVPNTLVLGGGWADVLLPKEEPNRPPCGNMVCPNKLLLGG